MVFSLARICVILCFFGTVPLHNLRAEDYHSQNQVHGLLDRLQSSDLSEKSKIDILHELVLLLQSAPPLTAKKFPNFIPLALAHEKNPSENTALSLAISLVLDNAAFEILAKKIVTPYAGNKKTASFLNVINNTSDLDSLTSYLDQAQSPQEKALGALALSRYEKMQDHTPLALLYGTMALESFPAPIIKNHLENLIRKGKNSNLQITGEKQHDILAINSATSQAMPKEFHRLMMLETLLSLMNDPLNSTAPLKDPIHICIGFDNKYAPHAAVTMLSAMLSAKPTTQYVFHVLQDKKSILSDANKEKIQKLMELIPGQRFKVEFEVFNTDLIDPVILENGHKAYWTPIILFKMYMQDFYKNLDRIMWLDSDILVRDDLSEFYNADMGNFWLMGGRDIFATTYLNRLGLESANSYLNVGVVLFNTKAIREHKGIEKIEKLFADNPDLNDRLGCPEQDIFAMAYKGKILEIEAQDYPSSQWNWCPGKMTVKSDWPTIANHPSSIIHMLSPKLKPWSKIKKFVLWRANPKTLDGIDITYWSLRDMTPWSTDVKFD